MQSDSSDLADQDTLNYVYDEIGNLIADSSENITSIEWNVYGKVRNVIKTINGNQLIVSYLYDAAGNRILKRILEDGVEQKATAHTRDASGNVMQTAITKIDTTEYEYPLYGSSRIGMYRGGTDKLHRMLGNKHYELSNHLGNVLAVVSDARLGEDSTSNGQYDYYLPHIVSLSDYYPFGLAMPNREYKSSEYRYGFNGKENDRDFGNKQIIQDYGFRLYNPSIAKFLSVDPLTSNFPWYTPYQFAGNNPILNIDLDGLEQVNQIIIHAHILWETKIKKVFQSGVHNIVESQSNSASYKVPQVPKNTQRIVKNQQLATGIGQVRKSSSDAAHVTLDIGGTIPVIGEGLDMMNGIIYVAEGNYVEGGISFVAVLPLIGEAAKGGKYAIRYGVDMADALKYKEEIFSSAEEAAKFVDNILCACFLEGTLVKTAEGYVEIQDLKAGDKVWSYDKQTGHLELKEVTNTFIIHEPEKIYYLYIGSEMIEVTGKHPFYIDGEWVDVQYLEIGDSVQLYSGEKLPIDSIQIEEGQYTVYNFSVEEFATYYVSETGILVHNCAKKKRTFIERIFGLNKGDDHVIDYHKATQDVHRNMGSVLTSDEVSRLTTMSANIAANKSRWGDLKNLYWELRNAILDAEEAALTHEAAGRGILAQQARESIPALKASKKRTVDKLSRIARDNDDFDINDALRQP